MGFRKIVFINNVQVPTPVSWDDRDEYLDNQMETENGGIIRSFRRKRKRISVKWILSSRWKEKIEEMAASASVTVAVQDGSGTSFTAFFDGDLSKKLIPGSESMANTCGLWEVSAVLQEV